MKTVVTHSGGFHSDDVFAVAAFQLLLGEESMTVVRTRDDEVIVGADYVVDVGGVYDHDTKRYDHHQNGSPVRENGIPYAGFGLMWKHYGEEIAGSAQAAETVDVRLAQPIDAGDNGVSLYTLHGETAPFELYNIIGSHAPVWGSDSSIDEAFFEAVKTARGVLERCILQAQAGVAAAVYAKTCYEAASDKSVVVCDRAIGTGFFVEYPEVQVVVAPAESPTEDTWKAKCVAVEHRNFATRVSFPEAWAGLRDNELATVSGIEDAVFTHKARFLFVAKSQESAIKAAKLAK
jgi:uncharacterized UPF0160 family protein